MASSERTRPRASAVVWGVLGLALLIAGMATHFYVTDAAALERQDSNLRRMERVGPPADLEPLYQSLSSDVLSLRDDKSGQAIAAATYIGTLYDWANPITGVGTLLPGGVTHVLNRLRALTPDQHAALFLAPLSALNSDAVSVLVAKKHLPATIYEADSTMDVAVLRVVLDDAALNQFPTTIPFATGPVPDKAVPLGRLVLVRNPEHGKARLVITTGGLRSQIQGGSWCDHRVDGPDVGSPIAVNTTHDGPFLIGIAGLSPAPGPCQIEGVGQFPRLISAIAL